MKSSHVPSISDPAISSSSARGGEHGTVWNASLSSNGSDGAIFDVIAQASSSRKDHNVVESSAKRQKMSQQPRAAYPRKRAIAACQACRTRRTKCNNERPACGACLDIGAQCTYQNQASDLSSFDPASIAILEKLKYVCSLLESQGEQLKMLQSNSLVDDKTTRAAVELAPDPEGFLPHPPLTDSEFNLRDLSSYDDFQALMESIDLPVSHLSSYETVLRWPIFEGKYSSSDIEAAVFGSMVDNDAKNADQNHEHRSNNVRTSYSSSGPKSTRKNRGVREDDVLELTASFLANVHTKNPILDPRVLQNIARRISEDGFDWDAESCLSLIICALGTISEEFSLDNITTTDTPTCSLADVRDYDSAEAYYVACRKRLGFLSSTTLATQCYFLVGVYEMYSLRPLQAWISFHRACTTFQTYLLAKSKQVTLKFVSDQQSLENRLYWSCLKSECEMRLELDVPSSGLARISFPSVFPTPPRRSPSPTLESPWSHSASIPSNIGNQPDIERTWYYYLAEIAARRMENRLTHSFYDGGSASWLSRPVEGMLRVASELEAQHMQWQSNIPNVFTSDDSTEPTNELQWMLGRRADHFKLKLYRPFLFLVIHAASDITSFPAVERYAQNFVHECVEHILGTCITHRHHGTWYGARELFLNAILLLAAVKSGRIVLPEGVRAAVDRVDATLYYWRLEAPDLETAQTLLRQITLDVFGHG